jgi:hypothetical protein
MRRVHLVLGILTLVAFALTGQVMLRHVPPMRMLGDDVRLMYRSRHIYLLGSGIANVLLGLYVVPLRIEWRRVLQYVGSALLLAAPVLLGLAFLAETGHGMSRTWRSARGLQMMLAGTVLHFVAAVRREEG